MGVAGFIEDGVLVQVEWERAEYWSKRRPTLFEDDIKDAMERSEDSSGDGRMVVVMGIR